MTSSDFHKSIISLACWRAAKDEIHHVMLCVCMVFRNRALAEGKDLYDVAVEWLTDNPGEFPDTRDPQFQQLLSQIEAVISNLALDKTDGALWFVPKESLSPYATAFTPTTTVGQMVFLKEK